MKLLLVVVSALVLIVYSKFISSNYRQNPTLVFYIKSYDDDYKNLPKRYRNKFGKAERRRTTTPQINYETEHIPRRQVMPPEPFKIPFITKHCGNSSCQYLCSVLEYSKGGCVSEKVCHCHKRTSNIVWRI